MRGQLLEAFARHHRRRNRRQRVVGGFLAVALLAAAGTAWTLTGMPAAHGPQAASVPAFSVHFVHGSPRSGLVQAIGDEELLQQLEEIGRPAGLIRIEGRTLLTDAAPARPQQPPAL
jgi:hypothetical protein